MRLSLSVRIAETATVKDRTAIPFDRLAREAHEAGYRTLCMRASVVSVDSSPERVAEVRATLDRLGLAVSMVTGDVALAANTPDATAALRNVTPYLDLAEALGSNRIRVMMHREEDVAPARRAADEADERGIVLCHQMHMGTLFETVDGALDVVRRVDRRNFGITYEPANLMICGDDYGPAAIARLAPHIRNVYFQNQRVDPSGTLIAQTWRRGPVPTMYVPIFDRSGIDVSAVVDGLERVGYDGWFTVHQTLQPGQTVRAAMVEAYQTIAPLL